LSFFAWRFSFNVFWAGFFSFVFLEFLSFAMRHLPVSVRNSLSFLLAVVVATAAAGCGKHHRGLVVGAVEDAAKSGDPHAQMQLARDSGFGAVALSAVWKRGEQAPPEAELGPLRKAVDAADEADVEPVLAIYQFSGDTPVTDSDRSAFASYAAALVEALPQVRRVIVGNEPNLNLFWQPQFDAGGGDAAASAFEALLASAYDRIKSVRDVTVIAAGLAPRGADDPASPRQTHSPTRFIADLGAAYRASGRARPPLDAFAIHPYGESPHVPPTLRHRRTTSLGIADYPKLRRLLRAAYGVDLPIVYGEYGVETTIPAGKQSLYSGQEVVHTVDEATQARFYRRSIALAACQPTVSMLLLFHVQDEPRLEGLQSGVRYADGSPKSSLAPVRRAAADASCHR
jgi:hypothetical protein